MDRSICEDAGVPKLPRSAGALGLALTAFDAWQRLSPRQRRLLLGHAKRYGPLIAAQAARSAKAVAKRRG
jgi:hypothetical protein